MEVPVQRRISINTFLGIVSREEEGSSTSDEIGMNPDLSDPDGAVSYVVAT